jgi:ribulose-phosphate 3-epimerase
MAIIVPSILSANFARLAEEIEKVERGGASMLHVDIMDGHFVDNITIGPPVVESIRKSTRLKLDLHLMIEHPQRYIPAFADAGADMMSVHQEACVHLDGVLRTIRERGVAPGVVLNPATPIAALEDVLYLVDHVLIMSVNPGYGGQRFIERSLHKVRELAAWRERERLQFSIEIDGGVSRDNVESIVRAGVDWLVAGSHIFHSADPTATVKEMQHLAAEATAIRV